MKKLEKYIISAAAAGIITIGCHTVTYADVSDTGTAVEETVSGPEETLSADMTSDYANVNTDIPNDNAADMAVMTSPDSIMDASAVSTDSITVSGEFTIDESTEDISGTNWSFDAENNGATETDNALIMVNAGIEKVSVETDLTIVSAGVNRIAELLLSGAADVKVAGSGLFMIDRLGCSEGFTGSLGLTEGGSAALFLKSGADEYTLMNPSSAPGILDEAYILSGYDFIIPNGTELLMPVTTEDVKDPDTGAIYTIPVSAPSLTVASDSNLTIESGAKISTEYKIDINGQHAAESEIKIEGGLTIESGAEVKIGGSLEISEEGTLSGDGIISGSNDFAKLIYKSKKSDTTINAENIGVRIDSKAECLNCHGECDIYINADLNKLISNGTARIFVIPDTPDSVKVNTIQADKNCSADIFLPEWPYKEFGYETTDCRKEFAATDIIGEGALNLHSGLMRVSGDISVSEMNLNGILEYSGKNGISTPSITTLSNNELVFASADTGPVSGGTVISTVRTQELDFTFTEKAVKIEAAVPDDILYRSGTFYEENQTYATVLNNLGCTESTDDHILTNIRVVYKENGTVKVVNLTEDSSGSIPTSDIVNITVMFENIEPHIFPAGTHVSTNTAYTGSGILGEGGMINTDGSSILIVIQSSSDPEDPDTPVDPEDPDVPADITGTSLTATAPEASHGYYPVAATAASDGLVSVTLQSDFLESVLEQEYQGIIINTEIGNVRIEKQDLRKLVSQTKSKSFRLVISSREEETEAGTKTVYTVSLYSGNVLIGNIEGLYTISLPYELKQGENAKDLKVMGTYSDGRSEEINCTFDEAAGMVIFRTNRLGDFTITFSEPSENI